MKLNIHSNPAKLYRAFYNKDTLPNNLCDYFWAVVLAIICIPFTYPILIINAFLWPIYYDIDRKKYCCNYERLRAYFGLIMNILFVLAGIFLCKEVYGRETLSYIPFWKIYLNGIGFALGIASVFLGFVFGLYLISKILDPILGSKKNKEYWDKLDERKKQRQSQKERSFRYLIKKQFKAWKEKNCPIIEWTNEK